MTIRLSRYLGCLAIGVFLTGAPLRAASGPQELSRKAALAGFQMGVNDYLTARWQATRDLLPLPSNAKFPEIVAAIDEHVRAVRKARADVRRGNVFGQDITTIIRETIDFTLEEYDIDVRDLLAQVTSDVPKGTRPARVNDRFPWMRGAAMPVVLIEALPHLPYGLQYRLVGRDLVLLDMDLELVIDILPKALPKN